jgi:hypothetical protein
MGEENLQGFDGKAQGDRPLGRPGRRWEDEIRMYLREIGWRMRSGFNWLRIGAGGGMLRSGDEHLYPANTSLVYA